MAETFKRAVKVYNAIVEKKDPSYHKFFPLLG